MRRTPTGSARPARLALTLAGVWVAMNLMAAGDSQALRLRPADRVYVHVEAPAAGRSGAWMRRGLGDMLAHWMRRTEAVDVIDGAELRAVRPGGVVKVEAEPDPGVAIERARAAGATVVAVCRFTLAAERVTLEATLLSVPEGHPVGQAKWSGPREELLEAARSLVTTLAQDAAPANPQPLVETLDDFLPRRIEVAELFYSGLVAFDEGRYEEALGAYRRGVAVDAGFPRLHEEILHMLYLLGRAGEAVDLALSLAAPLEDSDPIRALIYYRYAARRCIEPLGDRERAISILSKIIEISDRHEERTGEAARTRREIQARLDRLSKSPGYHPRRTWVKNERLGFTVWSHGFEDLHELHRRGQRYQEDGEERTRLVPEPSVWLQRTQAQVESGRLLADAGRMDEAAARFDAALAEYAFLLEHPLYGGDESGSFFPRGLAREAYFLILRHLTNSGTLIRSKHALSRVQPAAAGQSFSREGSLAEAHPAALTSCIAPEGDRFELFDFLAPPGERITALTLHAGAGAPVTFTVRLPEASGTYGRNYRLSRELESFTVAAGETRAVSIPAASELLAVVARVPVPSGLADSGGPAGPSTAAWSVSFAVAAAPNAKPTRPDPPVSHAAQDGRTRRYVDDYGWDEAHILPPPAPGEEPAPGGVEDWLAVSGGDDIHLIDRRRPDHRVPLPVSINTDQLEYHPTLLGTHEGGFALAWTRGVIDDPRGNEYFVARSRDLRTWEPPRRLIFDRDAKAPALPAPDPDSPRERSFNIARARDGYLMLLDGGYLRRSTDLVHWSAPSKRFQHDAGRYRSYQTRHGRAHLDATRTQLFSAGGVIWIVCTHSAVEPVDAHTPVLPPWRYWLEGGRRVVPVETLHVSSSRDGVDWTSEREIALDRYQETQGMWGLALPDGRLMLAFQKEGFSLAWVSVDALSVKLLPKSPVDIYAGQRDLRLLALDDAVGMIHPSPDGTAAGDLLFATSRSLARLIHPGR